jgi:alkane 1-monooxygenase
MSARNFPAQHLIAFLFLAAVPLAERIGGAAPFLIAPVLLLIFVGGDAMLGRTCHDQPAEDLAFPHRILPWIYIVLQLAVIAFGVIRVSEEMDPVQLVGNALATGLLGGVFGTLAAHEMIHAPSRAERALGTVMLAALTCLHFRIAHLHLHHRLAATPADPSTARSGESFYRFLLRSLLGQWQGAFRFERRRAAQRGRPILANRAIRYAAATAALYGAVAAIFGLDAVLFQALQSLVAILVLELFNYVAHYGMVRAASPDGGREPIGPQHSWNTSHRFNNWALFNGGHHSDHHRVPARSFQHLGPLPATPQLPFGYAGTLLLALLPPVWRWIMERRLSAARRPATPLAAAPSPRASADQAA